MVNKFFLVMLCLTVFSVFSASSSSASDPKNEDKTGQKAFEATHKIDLNKEDIIKHLPRLIGEGLFPGLTKDDYFAEDITRATSGTSRQQIILLGIHRRPIPNSDTDASASDSNATGRKILYILKNINDNGEIANIKEAYNRWGDSEAKKGRSGIITANVIKTQKKADGKVGIGQSTYRLKLAWHERIFYDTSTKEYYELLHAAKGQLMSSYKIPMFPIIDIIKEVDGELRSVPRFITSTGEYVDVDKCGYKDAILNPFYSERLRIARNLPDDASKQEYMKSDIPSFTVAPNEPGQKLFISIEPYPGMLPFKINNGTPEVDDKINWEEACTAYEAFGAVLGAVFREKDIQYDQGTDLDPHHNNIFFDKSSNTITWIDLDMLGGKLSRSGHSKLRQKSALHQALNYNYWSGIFMRGGFKNGVLEFHPDAKAEGILKLKGERDRIFNNIRRLYESFANAFIQNYDPTGSQREKLTNYFRTTFVLPFNENPQWKDPEEVKGEIVIYNPFACFELKK